MKYGSMSKNLLLINCLLILSIYPTISHAAFKASLMGDATQLKKTVNSASTTTDGFLAPGFGLFYEIMFRQNFGLETGVAYLQRSTGDATGSQSSNWVQVPILAKWHLGSFTFGAGGFYSSGQGNLVFTDTNEQKTTTTLSENYKTSDYGAQLQVGYEFVSKYLFELRYNQGLSNISINTDDTIKTTSLQIILGIKF